ncbi:MAG: T9SS type A sorting domain-containing protein [Flavobacteriia bacterium]|nr:T9SS type A sorting domain-containing protein [Flavobacteriia bacterium]
MHKLLFSIIILLTYSFGFSQEYIAVVQSPYVVLLNAETGAVEDPQFINLTPQSPSTPKGIRQVGNEIWVTDQVKDAIFRYDMDGNYISTINGNMDNIKGLDVINNNEVWVTNAGTANGASGDAVVRFDTSGNYLGYYLTGGKSSFDILDNKNGEVYISYISGGSPIERWDYSGNFLGNIVEPNVVSFAEQMWIMEDGNLLVATFSGTSGIYIFDISTGTQLNFWPQSGARGAIETGDGNILWTSGSGIFLLNPSTGTSTTVKSGSAQFFALIGAEEGCTTPTLSVEGPAEICEGSTATLTANTDGEEVKWYDSEFGTTPLFTGTEFTTPALTSTTSYWAQAFNYGSGGGSTIEGGARVAPTSNSSSSVVTGTKPWGLSFDTYEDFTITSVDVYLASNSPGTLVMQLLDDNWQLLDQTTISCPAGNASNPVQFEVPLNFSVDAGKTYRLVADQSPVMVREFSSEHPGFPYPIGSAGSVTGGTINNSNTNNTVYYFFYNWTVQTGSGEVCESDRVEFTVNVNPAPDAPTGEADQYFHAGDTLDDLVVNATGDLNWYEDAGGTVSLPSNTPLVDETTYYVSQTVGGCESALFAITVHLIMGTNDVNQQLFSVYPNPVETELFITGKQLIKSVEIFDATGRKLNKLDNISNGMIDFGNYKSGVYLIRIHSDSGVQTLKVIKK